MPDINEHIVVIGGGYAGMLSAIQLKMAGYRNVTVLEKNEAIFRGPSRDAFRLHLGGEYPQDAQTGEDCLKGAITFKQMFPADVFTPVPPVNFLVANETEREGAVTVDRFIEYYQGMQQQYRQHLEQYIVESELAGARVSPEEAAARLFGNPDEFFKRLNPEEYSYARNVAGGFSSKEEGINPIPIVKYLEDTATRLGIKIEKLHEVTDVKQAPDGNGFHISVSNKDELIYADQVVNASWQSAFALNHKVNPDRPAEQLNVFLRGMGIVDITEVPEAQRPQADVIPPTFVMNGANGGMYCPINDKVAAIYRPSEQGAYIDSATLTVENPTIPEGWKSWMSKNGEPVEKAMRQAAILRELKEGIFPFLENARPDRLLVHPTISYDGANLSRRRDAGVEEVLPGFHSAVPTKATYAARTSLTVLQKTLAHSVAKGKITGQEAEAIIPHDEIPVRLPDHLSIAKYLQRQRQIELEQLAERTGLPRGMAAGRLVTGLSVVGITQQPSHVKRPTTSEVDILTYIQSLAPEEKRELLQQKAHRMKSQSGSPTNILATEANSIDK